MVEVASSKSMDALEKISKEELVELKGELEKKRDKLDFISVIKLVKVLSRKVITRELLGETKIGKTISSLGQLPVPEGRKDLDSEVQEIRNKAAELVE